MFTLIQWLILNIITLDVIDLKIIRDNSLFGIIGFDFFDQNSNKFRETLMLYFDSITNCKCIK